MFEYIKAMTSLARLIPQKLFVCQLVLAKLPQSIRLVDHKFPNLSLIQILLPSQGMQRWAED